MTTPVITRTCTQLCREDVCLQAPDGENTQRIECKTWIIEGVYAETLRLLSYIGWGLSVPVLDGLWRGGGSQLGHEDSHDVEQEDEINLRETQHRQREAL